MPERGASPAEGRSKRMPSQEETLAETARTRGFLDRPAPDGGLEVASPTTRSRARRTTTPTWGSDDREAVVGTIRALWDAVEHVEPSRRAKLFEQIVAA